MSKRQEKIAQNIKEQQEFIHKRRQLQLSMFEKGVQLGNAFYEANKENISPEEQAMIEVEMQVNEDILKDLRKVVNDTAD